MIRTIILGTALAISSLYCAAEVGNPGSKATAEKDSGLSAAQLEQRGDIFRSQNDLAEAKHYYELALHKNVKNARVWNKLAIMALRGRDYNTAQVDLLQALKHDKSFAEAVNNLGVVYYLKKDYNRAEAQYRRAIQLSDTASFHSNLGALYLERDEPKLALDQYRIALQMDPQILERNSPTGISARTTTPLERGRYAFLLARLYAKLGDVNHSLDHLKVAVQNGYKPPEDFMSDSDFATVRQDPRFPTVMGTPAEVTQ